MTTRRDEIANAALPAIITSSIIGLGWKYSGDPAYSSAKSTNPAMLATAAYEVADAMLKQKEKYETEQ